MSDSQDVTSICDPWRTGSRITNTVRTTHSIPQHGVTFTHTTDTFVITNCTLLCCRSKEVALTVAPHQSVRPSVCPLPANYSKSASHDMTVLGEHKNLFECVSVQLQYLNNSCSNRTFILYVCSVLCMCLHSRPIPRRDVY